MNIQNSYIFIDGLLLMVNIGTTEKERQNKQKIELSFKIWTDFSKAIQTDNIRDTINYDDIINTILKHTKNKAWNLLETFVKEIGDLVIRNRKISKVALEAKKFILNNCKSTGVNIVIVNDKL